tara:strand:+ start:1817 stop:2509 length:693 start_codon:yes stop_codon:yes gene_type:complete
MKFSIIIPILNESESILKLTYLLKKNLKKVVYEIIFVDDNSSDNTLNILKSIKSKNINFIIRKKEKDLSKSCVEGIKKSKNNNIIIMDGDLQHKPSCLKKMISIYKKEKPDVLVGIREFSEDKSLSFTRKFLSKLIIFFINRIFFVKKTNDPMSGFFILKKEVFLRSKNKLYNSGFKILFDIIFSYNNIKVLDYKINFGQRKFNKSKLNFKIVLKIVVLIIFKLFQKKIN